MVCPFRCQNGQQPLTRTATTAHAQVVSHYATNNICCKANVPDASASSGSGDLYFQIQGPSSLQWIGLGQGGSMQGAQVFMVYSSASGSNVTLSPRLSRGNFQPSLENSAQVSLLAGSGIADNVMTANVRCKSLKLSMTANVQRKLTTCRRLKVRIALPGVGVVWTSLPAIPNGSGPQRTDLRSRVIPCPPVSSSTHNTATSTLILPKPGAVIL